MEKNNRDPDRNVREIENDRPMPDERYVNGRSPSATTKDRKRTFNLVNTGTRKGSKVLDRANGAQVSSQQTPRKISRKKRKKMGLPIIVEDRAGEHPVVPLPLTLRHGTERPAVAGDSPGSFDIGKKKNQEKTTKARITTAERVKPDTNSKVNKKLLASNDGRSVKFQNQEISPNSMFPTTIDESPRLKNQRITDSKNLENPVIRKNTLATSEIHEQRDIQRLPRFYSFRNKVLAIMEADCKFSFHGKLRVRVLYGAVRIYGYTLTRKKTISPMNVYSPRAWSPVAIEAVDSDVPGRCIDDIWESLDEDCNDRKLANRLQTDLSNVEEGWAMVILEKFDDELTTFLMTNSPFHLFPRIDDPSNHSWRDSRRAEIVLQANLGFQDSYKAITIDSRGIDDVADAISYNWETKENSRTIVAGGKGVGKSTMSRYLVNKLLAKSETIVFLDLDPGQAEFTPAGSISLNVIDEPLLGPNFTHLKTPYYQLYVGSADVTRCLTHYVDGIKKLVDRLNDDTRLSQRPLVVNTMGHCKGIGWDIMCYVIKILSPTDIIQILSRRTKNNFDDTLSRQVIDRQTLRWMTWRKDSCRDKPTRHRLHVIYSEAETGTGPAESWNLEAYQKRDLAMVSYLSEIVKINEFTTTQTRTITSCINAAPPYVIPFASMSVSLAGAFVPRVLSVMNGNIVALCGVDQETTNDSNCDESLTASYPRILIRPPLSTCYGFGILRGVDMEKKQLFLNTPIPLSHMKHVNCLIGSINVPQSLRQINQQDAPYTGSEYDLPTSREPRRGYFRARYQVDT